MDILEKIFYQESKKLSQKDYGLRDTLLFKELKLFVFYMNRVG